jgi:hypothetical protein
MDPRNDMAHPSATMRCFPNPLQPCVCCANPVGPHHVKTLPRPPARAPARAPLFRQSPPLNARLYPACHHVRAVGRNSRRAAHPTCANRFCPSSTSVRSNQCPPWLPPTPIIGHPVPPFLRIASNHQEPPHTLLCSVKHRSNPVRRAATIYSLTPLRLLHL